MFLQGRLDRLLESAREYVRKGEGLDRGGSIESRGTLYAKRKAAIDPITGHRTQITKRVFTPAEARDIVAQNAETYRRGRQAYESYVLAGKGTISLDKKTLDARVSETSGIRRIDIIQSLGLGGAGVDLKTGQISQKWLDWDKITSAKLNRFAEKPGGEGIAFHSPDKQFAYKLFIPTEEGIGGRAQILPTADGQFGVDVQRGTLDNLLQRISLMGKLGAVPMEIVGIDKNGVLLVKMPYGEALSGDLEAELKRIRAVEIPKNIVIQPKGATTSIRYYATVIDEKPYLLTDIWHRNAVNNTFGEPRLLDFFISEIPEIALSFNPELNSLIKDLRKRERYSKENRIVRFSKTPRANPFETPEGRALFYRVEQAYKPGHGTRSFWKPCARPLT